MPYLTTEDGTQIFYIDWGDGAPVLLSHGWPLNSDAWEASARFLAERGHRVVAHDRRGHGRSTRSWNGNDMDTYADDLACLVDRLDLSGLTLVGHSTGGGEVVRYVARHGSARVARMVLVSAVPPLMVHADDNPGGLPLDVFDGIRAGEVANRSQLYRDLADGPFFGHNRSGAIAQGTRDAFWSQGLASGTHNAHECIAAFSATDFRKDLAAIDVPVLVIHGDDDQIVPFEISGRLSAQLIPDARLVVYAGGAHGLPDTARERLHADLLAFIGE
ncbi:alpha/beta hydrolase [Microbacterium sp. B35-04]|uniref:alpha/beta fold hydrolase n=1 Tax=unclassified Microbacterium TaxID=2609290 RepID=UPI0013D2EF8B|nr:MULTISPECIES: alpha/beta hydrolase [unclassified Microbacterium]KAF2414028.1 alpha/beta hydrolase [Microbacterium sp. B35-04]KAF2416769.1 alpha/beta hydrolase [Microbacterium sp. B35-30]